MYRIGFALRSVREDAERRIETAGDGWFLLTTVLLLALPRLPFEVLLVGLGLAIAGFYWHLCEKRRRSR